VSKLGPESGVADVAVVVSSALHEAGIEAVLSGGAAVTIYSENRYQSEDLDFVTAESLRRITPVMENIGFNRADGRHFINPECPWTVDFVTAPVALGEEIVTEWARLEVPGGFIEILSPTQSIKDRLAAFFHWNDPQALEQALMVARRYGPDLDELRRWAAREGALEQFQEFRGRLLHER
jgi:hypothetical protein